MSRVLDQLKSMASSSGRCYVRVSDSMTYGPVALDTVSQWAAQGRVTSESEISFDQKRWVRADSIPELGLDWITISEGVDGFGPFNLQALSQLVRRGIVAPEAQLKHRKTEEVLDVSAALDRATASRPLDAAAARLLQTTPPLASEGSQSLVSHAVSLGEPSTTATPSSPDTPPSTVLVAELRREVADAEEARNHLEQHLEEEREGRTELQRELDRAREALSGAHADHKALQDESDARETEQGGGIAELAELLATAREAHTHAETECKSAQRSLAEQAAKAEQTALEIEGLRSRIDDVESALAAAHERGAVLEGDCERLKSDTTALAAELESSVAQQSALQIALEKRSDEFASLDQTARQAAQRAAERIAFLQSDLDEDRTTLGERQEEIALLTATHVDERSAAADEAKGLKDALAASGQLLDEREAKAAEERADLREQLKEARAAGAQRELESGLLVDTLKAEAAALTERLAAAESRATESEVASGSLRSELEVAQQAIAALEKQVRGQDKTVADRGAEIKELHNELEARDAAIEADANRLRDAEARVVEAKKAHADTVLDLEMLRDEHKAVEASAQRGRDAIEAEKASTASLTLETESLSASVEALLKEIEILRGERDAKQDRVASLSSELDHLKAQLDDSLAAAATAAASAATQSSEIDALRAHLADTTVAHAVEIETLMAQLADEDTHLTKQIAALKSELAEERSAHEAKQTEHDSLSGRAEEAQQQLGAQIATLEGALASREAELAKTEERVAADLAAAQEQLKGRDAAMAEARTEAAREAEAAETAHAAEVALLTEQLTDREEALTREAEALKHQLAEVTSAHEATLAEHGDLIQLAEESKQQFGARLSELEATLAAREAELVKTGERVAADLAAAQEQLKARDGALAEARAEAARAVAEAEIAHVAEVAAFAKQLANREKALSREAETVKRQLTEASSAHAQQLDALKAELAEERLAHEAKQTEHVDLGRRAEETKQQFGARLSELEATLAARAADLARAEAKVAADLAAAQEQ
ncbi:MAG: hypothetical protein HQ523_16190, partial [Lentisphaerae bacterium]|nr:hypothetical protein [Lentisphaerota bacterium]